MKEMIKEISQSDLSDLQAWMTLFDVTREVRLQDQVVVLNVFGKADDRYLVVNIYQSDCEADQYVLQSDTTDVSLSLIIEFLGGMGFSVTKLIAYLTGNFSDTNKIVTKNGLSILYEHQCAE
ncbi:MAG: hypothetical protein OEZ39_19830 [Gammaproteobacteria bacterium]|nr:hypothetical protein [Gammaproteobacteria bacterium]MDH5654118.1 hypothetical protein [Gammaproteobacteria bacterium]